MRLFSKPVVRTLEFLSIFGAVPFRWDKGKLVLRVRYSLLLILLSIGLIYESVFLLPPSINQLSLGLQGVINVFTTFMTTTTFVIFMMKKGQLESSLVSLVKIHAALCTGPIRVSVKAKIVFAILTALTALSSIWMCHLDPIHAIFNAVAWNDFILYRITLTMIFCFFIQIAGHCLKAITFLVQGSQKRRIPMEKLLEVYNRLVDDCNNLNSSFEVQLLLNLAYSLYQVTYNLYSMDTSQLSRFLSAMGSVLMSVIHTWYLFVCSESVMSKAKYFNKVLSNIALHNSAGQSEKNVYLTMHFLVGKKLKFQTYGGLILNYRLLLSITASSITYLMILLQFSESKEIDLVHT